jgi:flavin reductase (DIM6/NTAB) family NADH-FMN oxidoreductase RutF
MNSYCTRGGCSRLHLESAKAVQAPRIAECAVNLECSLEWNRPLYEGSRWHLLVGEVLHIAMDEAAMAPSRLPGANSSPPASRYTRPPDQALCLEFQV